MPSLVSLFPALESLVSVSPLSLDPSLLDSALPVPGLSRLESVDPDEEGSVPLSPESEDSVPVPSVPSDSDPVLSDPEFGFPVTLNGVSLVRVPAPVGEEPGFGSSPQALGIRFGFCSPVFGSMPTCCSSVGLPFALVPSAIS